MSEIKVDTLTGKTTANDITVTVGATATMSLEQGLTKAWVTYTDVSWTIGDSLNCSSATDVATADFATNFSSNFGSINICLLYTSPSPRDRTRSRMPSSA